MSQKCNDFFLEYLTSDLQGPKNSDERNFLSKPHPNIKIHSKLRLQLEAISAIEISKEKSMRDIEAISKALSKHFIFSTLPIELKVRMISQMKLYHMDPHNYVFKQNDIGKNFFIVAKGKVEVIVNGSVINTLSCGESFGELALLHDFPRTASVKTISSVYLWILDRKTFNLAVKAASSQSHIENEKFIEALPLFSMLTADQKNLLLENLIELKYSPNQKIVSEGEAGELCYFIKEGSVMCRKGKNNIRKIAQGGYFGEQALLNNSVRTASVIAETDLKCIAISRSDLERVLGSQLEAIVLENSKKFSIGKSEILNKFDNSQISKVMKAMKNRRFFDNELVISEGQLKKNQLLIVLHGKLKNSTGVVFETFNCIGETEILEESESVFTENLYSVEQTDISYISREEFLECIGYNTCKFSVEYITALKKVNILRSLPNPKFLTVAENFKIEKFQDQEVIFQQNTPGNKFYLIQSGIVNITQEGEVIRKITKNDYFGERSLLFNELRTASVIAEGEVSCWTLSKDVFDSILQTPSRKTLMKRIEMQDSTVKLSDLTYLKLLGKGTFGTVFLVAEKNKGTLFALKITSKKIVKKYELQEYIDLERNILKCIDHPFILKLVKHYETEEKIFLLTEFVNGLDLFDMLRHLNLVNENDSKFYVSCLLLILEYLHERNIVYRDLKPENIRIDEDGYPKLIDFGSSKIIKARTYTVIGTPHYMAPEIILGKGYGYSVDYWSLGIILYEMIFGNVPFGFNEDNPVKIYESILKRALFFPTFVKTTLDVKNFIEKLLNPSSNQRNCGGIDKVKNHAWLETVNWDAIIGKDVTSPCIPDLKESDTEIERVRASNINLEEAIEKILNDEEE